MDPISQGALGSVLPQSFTQEGRHLAAAGIVGFLAGMLPDVDVLIRSEEDPLLFLEYHRQFTHSLLFIPVGGLVAALVLHPLLRLLKRPLRLPTVYLFATLGYGTHGLLDACTSYGTQLFWPFADTRVAWNNVSIVDPLFTVPLLVTVIGAVRRGRTRWARVGLVWALLYLSLGVVQNQRAEAAGLTLARARGHAPSELSAKPTLGNLVLWKVIYRVDDRFYVDAVRVALTTRVYEGESIARLDAASGVEGIPASSTQQRDIERFSWFSGGYIARHPDRARVVGDIRYSLVPNEIEPLWGIVLDPTRPDRHAAFENFRADLATKQRVFLRMVLGRDVPPAP